MNIQPEFAPAGPPMRIAGAIALAAAVLGAGRAQTTGAAAIQSSSGQFVVFAVQSSVPLSRPGRFAADTNLISLEPALLAVSCERIKQRLWAQLGLDAPWRGRIYLDLRPAQSADEPVIVATDQLRGGWDYHVALADMLPRDRFVRAIVQVLLMEAANRNAGTHPAEVPTWLAEGLSKNLRASGELEMLLPPPRWNVHGLAISPQIMNARWANPLEGAQMQLRARPALSFEQMSWPADGSLAGEAGEVYRCSAQFFVDSLLRMADGPGALRAMLGELPQYYNWQLAFLHAFRAHFQNLLAVEKWWSLQLVQFTGHDLSEAWTPEESWRKLDEILCSPVDVRTRADELPLHAEVPLQTIIREWDRPRQIQSLQHKMAELDLLRLRISQSFVPLVDDYRALIQAYLRRRNPTGLSLIFGTPGNPNSDRVADQAIRQLEALDQRRAALRPPPSKVTAVTQGVVQQPPEPFGTAHGP